MAPIYSDNEKRRWRVKDTIYSQWRELPGTYTGAEIWAMLNSGRFTAAVPVDETPTGETTSDE